MVLSTIHASKGLEYPVCILVGTGSALNKTDKTPFHYSDELGLITAIPAMDGQVLLKTPLTAAHAAVKKKSEMAEAIRVLYVALTRPKEQLFVFCSAGTSGTDAQIKEAEYLRLSPTLAGLYAYDSYATWMLAALAERPSLFHYRELPPPYRIAEDEAAVGAIPQKEDTPQKAEEVPDEENTAALRERLSERFAFRYPYKEATRLPAKLTVSALYPGVLDEIASRSPMEAPLPLATDEAEDVVDGFVPTVPAFLSDKEEHAAALAGTATHLFLQFCDFGILTTDGCQNEVIKKELARLVDKGFLREADTRRVRVDELALFLRSSLCRELKSARKTYREFRFHAMLPAHAFSLLSPDALKDEVVFAQGVIDLLLVREDGSLLLVDYKTDRLSHAMQSDPDAAAEFLFARHGEQLSVYAAAVEKMLGQAVTVAIYSLPAGRLLFRK